MNNYTECVEISVFLKYRIEEKKYTRQLIFVIDCIIPIVRNLEIHNIYLHKEALGNHDHFTNKVTIDYMTKDFLLEVEKIQRFFTNDKNVLDKVTYEYYLRHHYD